MDLHSLRDKILQSLILFPVPGNKNKTNKPFSNEIIESWNNILLSSASKKKKIMDQYKAKQLLKFFLQKNKHEKCQVMQLHYSFNWQRMNEHSQKNSRQYRLFASKFFYDAKLYYYKK